jgi:ankyrin repeat protein
MKSPILTCDLSLCTTHVWLGPCFTQMIPRAVDAVISGEMTSLNQLRPLAPIVLSWLKGNLLLAHDDEELKRKMGLILGTRRFVHNLQHFGLWEDFIDHSKTKALYLGQEMQKYFEDNDLRTVLGKDVVPEVFGKCHVGCDGVREVVPCSADEGERRQTVQMSFSQAAMSRSQLWNEKCYIHCLRMVAMAIDALYQAMVKEICTRSRGIFSSPSIKGYVRMMNKCLSPEDHLWEQFPRPECNLDVNRNSCAFDSPKDLVSFIEKMKGDSKIGSHPVRIKNMMLFDTDRAEKQYFYRAILINWLYTPGFTYKELAKKAQALWDRYSNYEGVPGYGEKDPLEPSDTWRQQVRVARDFLESPEMEGKQVQCVVETQALLKPYLLGRQKLHFLYKIARASSPEALCSDFRAIAVPDARSFDEIEDDALHDVKAFLTETSDVNRQDKELQGATRLWKIAEQGHAKAAEEILRHPRIDPNKTRTETRTTPLYIAAHHGHHEVVRALLAHPKIKINVGNLENNASALLVASQEGHEMVVEMLLEAEGIDVNQATSGGVTPLCQACSHRHEHIVQLVLRASDINVEHVTNDGATAMTLSQNHRTIVKLLQDHLSSRKANHLSSRKTNFDLCVEV